MFHFTKSVHFERFLICRISMFNIVYFLEFKFVLEVFHQYLSNEESDLNTFEIAFAKEILTIGITEAISVIRGT